MLKKEFLEPFSGGEIKAKIFVEKDVKVEHILRFLNDLDFEDIKKIGNSLAFLYPRDILIQFSNKENIDKSFAYEFRKEYGLNNIYDMKTKHIGIGLVRELSRNNHLKPKEFIKQYKL